MLTISWDDRFLVGLPSIDNQHKFLFQLLNQLPADFVSNKSQEHLHFLFDNLSNYAAYHFSLEERWMVNQNFPLIDSHRNEHILFSKRVAEFRQTFSAHNSNVSLEIMVFLYGWLVNHIQGSDYEFGKFIEQRRFEQSSCILNGHTVAEREQQVVLKTLNTYSSDFLE